MKNPLHYQLSDYDCGPTAMLDALSYLFEREDIPPEVIRNVMLYSLDCYSAEGVPGKSGTSRMAMMFLSNWLNEFGKVGNFPVSSQYISGEQVFSEIPAGLMTFFEEEGLWWCGCFWMNGIMSC